LFFSFAKQICFNFAMNNKWVFVFKMNYIIIIIIIVINIIFINKFLYLFVYNEFVVCKLLVVYGRHHPNITLFSEICEAY
jgi:hypothetical protein